jgi:hypothetical protein
MRTSENINEIAKALSKFQADVKNPSNSAVNPQFKSKYAPLDVVINTVKPVLADNGLSFIQSTGSFGEAIIVTTLLMHESGQWIESDPLTLPAYQTKGGGVKEFNAQGAGSSLTYARRYSLSAILGLSSEDDDDGNHASGQGGYKEANKPSGNNGMSEADKEKKRQEALAKAEAKKNQGKQESTQGQTSKDGDGQSVEMISPAQKTAIGNLVKIVARTKGFDATEYLNNLVAVHGASELENLTQEQAKAVISQINADKNSK